MSVDPMKAVFTENFSLIERLTQAQNHPDNIQQGILRDVALLLNTRLTRKLPADFPELANTIVNYGLPDFSEFEANNSQAAAAIKHNIELLLKQHEPRLKDVIVTVNNVEKFSINFNIDATYMIEPNPVRIKFDSKYQPDLQLFDVKEQADEQWSSAYLAFQSA